MKKFLFLLLLAPLLCFSQKKRGSSLLVGGGYLFYPGSSADVHIGGHSNNPLKSGFTLELTGDQPVNSFLSLGLGASFNQFKDLGSPYVPVFADIRVMGQGKFRFFSFLNPGYGIYHDNYSYTAPPLSGKLNGGFYIAYGFGVLYKMVYLQAKYNWFRFSDKPGMGLENSSKAYGVGGITVGVRLP
jgi:hypothetical protein